MCLKLTRKCDFFSKALSKSEVEGTTGISMPDLLVVQHQLILSRPGRLRQPHTI